MCRILYGNVDVGQSLDSFRKGEFESHSSQNISYIKLWQFIPQKIPGNTWAQDFLPKKLFSLGSHRRSDVA